MTAAAQAGALSRNDLNWHAIDWHAAHRIARRLQARIVKATQDQRWGKVKALQRLITHSFSGKAFAVRQVTENSGKRTPGVDRVVWNTPAKKEAAVQTLKQRGYQPLPLRRLYIPKSNGKMRLWDSTMKDRAMKRFTCSRDPSRNLTPIRTPRIRKDRSTADAISPCFIALGKKHPPVILEATSRPARPISHDWMLAQSQRTGPSSESG